MQAISAVASYTLLYEGGFSRYSLYYNTQKKEKIAWLIIKFL